MLETIIQREPRYLLLVCLLTVCFFWLYYSEPHQLYRELEQSHSQGFWQGDIKFSSSSTDEAEREEVELLYSDLNISLSLPKYISSFADSEVILTFYNSNNDISFDRIDSVIIETALIQIGDSNDETKVPLLIREKDSSNRLSQISQSEVAVGPIPPLTTITKVVWVRIPSNHQFPKRSQSDTKNPLVDFKFWFRELETETTETLELQGPLYIPSSTAATVNSNLTLTRAVIGIILLPPWSNGFLVVLALICSQLIIVGIRMMDISMGWLHKKIWPHSDQINEEVQKHLNPAVYIYKTLISIFASVLLSWCFLSITRLITEELSIPIKKMDQTQSTTI